MMGNTPINERLMDLLADQALQGLSASESAELDSLLRAAGSAGERLGEDEALALELAAASVDVALMTKQEPMPAAVLLKLMNAVTQEAPTTLGRPTPRTAPTASGSGAAPGAGGASMPDVVGRISPGGASLGGVSSASGGSGLAWLAAAAALALAAVGWLRPVPQAGTDQVGGQASAQATPEAKERLVASAPDLSRWFWNGLGELQDRKVGGEVVWSTAKQQGFMTFEGLPPNDPSKEQYQLWIFDPSQSDKTPIDGGVFDVATTGEVIVPIDPKLRPAGPVMFAVTIEKPGGSVVSSRERLVLIAKPT